MVPKLIGTFVAKDGTGAPYQIFIFSVHEEKLTYGADIESAEAYKELRLRDGRLVNHISPGVYEIQPGSIRLTSDDPNAI